jgi:hypothetical protein
MNLIRPLALAAGLAFTGWVNAAATNPSTSDDELAPTGKGWGERATPAQAGGNGGAGPQGSNGILYHGGPVMTNGTNVYYIWYGTWSSTAQSILNNLGSSIGGSPYFNINTTYYDGNNVHVKNVVTFGPSTTDNYSLGKSLSDSNIQSIVASAINGGRLPKDTNGVYFVLTSEDVNETSGFCTQYCGWHTHGTIAGSDIKYAFIGNPARCPSACTNGTGAPNGDVGADGAASIIAHELEEATTDPDLNAWYDRRGMENADKCAWTFGTTYGTSNGALANVHLGNRDYLIQRNWVNAAGGYCSMTF